MVKKTIEKMLNTPKGVALLGAMGAVITIMLSN